MSQVRQPARDANGTSPFDAAAGFLNRPNTADPLPDSIASTAPASRSVAVASAISG